MTTEEEGLLRDVARDVFVHNGQASEQGWNICRDLGWNAIGVPLSEGGSGGELRQVSVILREQGYAGASFPLAEYVLATHLLSQAKEEHVLFRSVLEGKLRAVVLPKPISLGSQESFESALSRVAWGRWADLFVGVCTGRDGPVLLVLPAKDVTRTEGVNLAQEPRDAIACRTGEVPPSALVPARESLPNVPTISAFFRSAQVAGALRRALDLSLMYAQQRVQFGRQIGSFQAVGHNLASMAALCDAVDSAVSLAHASNFGFHAAASAKIVTAFCCQDVVRLAHQIHGAIGVTREHELHRVTLRAIAWSQESGAVDDWTEALGEQVAANPSDWWELASSVLAKQ